MKQILLGAIVTAGGAVAGAAASAATVSATFDFTSPAFHDQPSWTFTSDGPGIDVLVTGRTFTVDGSGAYVEGDAIDVDNNSDGLFSKNTHDEYPIDNKGPDESMIFDFLGRTVRITDIVIGWAEGTGFYDLFADGAFVGSTGTGSVVPSPAGGVFAIGTSDLFVTKTCTRIKTYLTKTGETASKEITYDCSYWAYSGIKIKSLTVAYDDGVPPAVPLPATGWMILAGLGGLAASRLRRAR